MNETGQTAHSRDNNIALTALRGTYGLATLDLLTCAYIFLLLTRQPATPIIYFMMGVFLLSIVAAFASIALTIRRRQELAAKTLYWISVAIAVSAVSLFIGRAPDITIATLLVQAMLIRWLFPSGASRRMYYAISIAVFILMWGIEWLTPPWRIQIETQPVGPAAVIGFGIILAVLVFLQTRQIVNRSIRLKITVWIGGTVIALFVILAGHSIATVRRTFIENAQKAALAVAESHARQIRADTETPLNIARALAQALTAVKDPRSPADLTRDDVNAMLRQVLVENPSYLGTYTLWEPNAFDGLDSQYRNQPVHDDTGRFIPYWIRSDDGSIAVIPLEQYETPGIGDWYVLPRQNKTEMTFAPLIYPINGVDTVMASFVAPIMYNDTFYGIAGVDAPIGFVQEILDSIDLYDGKADAVLLASSGTLIGASKRPELVNQPATEIYADFADLQPRIAAGEAFISMSPDGNFLRVFAPVEIGQTGQPWSFGLIIPFSEVTAPATAVALQQAGVSLGLIVLFFLLLWYLSNQLTRPIVELTETANAVTQGNLGVAANVQSRDETGILANAFNAMTRRLRETLQGLEQRVADRTRNLELAAEVGRAVSQVRALDVMLKDACELILKEFNLYYVQVYLTDPGGSTLRLEAGTGTVGLELLGRGHSLPVNTGSINGRAVVEKRSVVISDTAQSATFHPNKLLPETRGEMAVPLIVADKVVGALDMQASQPGVLTDEILPAFEALAGQLAVAIQNANLLAETEQARAQVEAQARRLARAGWDEYLDAIHKPERLGFVYDRKQVLPLTETDGTQTADERAVSAPISVTGEALGSLAVEIEDETRRGQALELVNAVSRQVAQQIENLRLLESAERFRTAAEDASRRLTREGWRDYLNISADKTKGYAYDLKEVRPVDANAERSMPGATVALPIKLRGETIGKISLQGVAPDDADSIGFAGIVAERLSAHVENLRLNMQTEQALATTRQFGEREQALRQITSAVRSSTDPAVILRTAARELGTMFGRRVMVQIAEGGETRGQPTTSNEASSTSNSSDGGAS